MAHTVIYPLDQGKSPYIYSNPITPAEAAAAIESLRIADSAEGQRRLATLRGLGQKLRQGLSDRGLETIMGDHPIVPILVRDTERTLAMVTHLFESNILVTGLNYPVVPRGDEEIRLQLSASHTESDIDLLLGTLRRF